MHLVLSVLIMSAFAVLGAFALVYSGILLSYLLFGRKKGKTKAKSVATRPHQSNLNYSYQHTPISNNGDSYQEMVKNDADFLLAKNYQSRVKLMKQLTERVIAGRGIHHPRYIVDVLREVDSRAYALEHKKVLLEHQEKS